METTRLSVIEIQPQILRKYRKNIRESQGRFWARFGVTQSRGSRFEKGAEIPLSVVILLELYFNGVVTDGDLNQALHRHHSNQTKTDAELAGAKYP